MTGNASILSQAEVCSMLQMMIFIPVAAGLLLLFVPEKYLKIKSVIALLFSILAGFFSVRIYASAPSLNTISAFINKPLFSFLNPELVRDISYYFSCTIDGISKFIVLFIGIMSFLIMLYSIVYIKAEKAKDYYTWFLITIGCSFGAALSDNMLLFLTFWGILGITLYKLIPGKTEESSAAAKKTLILIGSSDTIMMIGIAIIWRLTGSVSMSEVSLPTDNILIITAFLALVAGSFTKAGAFPFHTWVPDYAREAPATSSALMPASLDKLLGIYFLARITTHLFILSDGMRVLLLTIGVVTIIAAVMMALVQHNCNRLLGYHAVSQVGYMILGFGIGSFIGIAAGLFHMVNNVIYKSGLFLSSGSVEYRTGKQDIDDLGGLSRAMPVTFISSLIFAMSISGIPPLNGFASKWMIYQGIIDFGSGAGVANKLWVLWLGLAVLGSALTLASFIKLVGGVFLGRQKREFESIHEAPVIMWLPTAILALVCLFFGVFATSYVVPKLFTPITGDFLFAGVWNSSLVTLLVLISFALGGLIYLLSGIKKFRHEDSFIGGEKMQEITSYPTTEFYKSIGEFRLFSWIFRKAEEKLFDIYDLSKQFVLWFSHQLSEAHTGVLTGYIIWVFAGLIIMLLIML